MKPLFGVRQCRSYLPCSLSNNATTLEGQLTRCLSSSGLRHCGGQIVHCLRRPRERPGQVKLRRYRDKDSPHRRRTEFAGEVPPVANWSRSERKYTFFHAVMLSNRSGLMGWAGGTAFGQSWCRGSFFSDPPRPARRTKSRFLLVPDPVDPSHLFADVGRNALPGGVNLSPLPMHSTSGACRE